MALVLGVTAVPRATSSSEQARIDLLDMVRLRLIEGRTWRYLRYLHLRDILAPLTEEVETICVCGVGHSLAEFAIAIEFPQFRITATDIVAEGYPNYHQAMSLCWEHGIDNLQFSIWNVLQPSERRFDLVCSTEVLEHIKDDSRAAANMTQSARKYIYCLVPYSDVATKADKKARERAWRRHGHFRVGYDADDLSRLFPDPVRIRGTYWKETGQLFRKRLDAMNPDQMAQAFSSLLAEAEQDLVATVPTSIEQAAGIKILSAA